MKNFSFNLFSNPQTKAWHYELRNFKVNHERLLTEAVIRAEELDNLHKQRLEDYFATKGVVIDPLDHNIGYNRDKERNGFVIHSCRISDESHDNHQEINFIPMDPFLMGLIERHHADVEAAKEKSKNEMLENFRKHHEEPWSKIEGFLAAKGLIQKDADGDYPSLNTNGRMVSIEEDGGATEIKIPSSFMDKLSGAMKGFVKGK